MKVKIEYTVDVSDEYREAINLFYGKPGLATRAEVKRWFEAYGESQNDDIMWELRQKQEADEQEAP